MTTFRHTFGSALFAACILASSLHAQVLSLGIGSVGNDGTLSEQVSPLYSERQRGFQFAVANDFSIAGLAVFDLGSDGWTGSPTATVSLWSENSLTEPVLTLEIAADAPLFGSSTDFAGYGQFRTATLGTPLSLLAGTYRVTADMSDIATPGVNDFIVLPTAQTITTASGVSVLGAINGTTLRTDRHAFLGGNVLFSVIPEPSTYALVFAGLVGAVAVWKRRRR